ncbi:MAG: hypothetical protein KA419_05345 [Acidobacteria bacterium]|nr:hypothetical protein [Acidobacteriota bacterium]
MPHLTHPDFTVPPNSNPARPRCGVRAAAALVLLGGLLALAPPARAQAVVDTLYSAPDTHWVDMALYPSGNKLFVADNTHACIRVFDSASLASLGVISLSSYLPDRPQSDGMVVHDGTGTLYVVVDQGYATSVSRIVVIDADTHAVLTTLTGVGNNLMLALDAARSRLFTFGNHPVTFHQTLTAFDVNTNTAVGTVDIETLMGEPHSRLNREGGIDPVTGRTAFSNIHRESFLVIDGTTLSATRIDAAGSQGWNLIWNPQENRVVITDFDWNYLSFDLDSGGSTHCITRGDGEGLFYSSLTNRVYSGTEITEFMYVIDGPTGACQEVSLGGGLPEVGFVNGKRQVCFVNFCSVYVLGEDLLDPVTRFNVPGPGGGGTVDTQILVQPGTQRVFIRGWRDLTEGELSQVLVIDGLAPVITAHPQPATLRKGQSAALSVTAAGTGTLHYQWFHGVRGDTANPAGTDSPGFTTPALDQTTRYWVRVTDELGRADSREAVVTVDPAPGNWFVCSAPTTRDLYGLSFIDARNGWAAGEFGTLLQSSDGGKTWVLQTSGTNKALYDVCFADSLHGWAPGGFSSTFILKTADGGKTWASKPSGTDYRLFRARFVDAQTGWAVGEMGTILKTTDGGETWTPQPTGTSDWFYDAWFFDAANGWAVGSTGTVRQTTDGGANWTNRDILNQNHLNGVCFVGPDTGWIASGDNVYENRGRINSTVDGGMTWPLRNVEPFDQCLKSVAFVNPTTGWTVGLDGTILKTLDGGSNWFAQPSGTTADLNRVQMIDAGLGYAVGSGGTILKYVGLDVNRDGTFDALDAVTLAAFLAEGPPLPAGPGSGDLNADGAVNALDLMALRLALPAD